MVTIRQKLVSTLQAAKVTSGKNNAKKYIVIHETDNTNAGADADAHARLQFNGNIRAASWHWQVDANEAVQSFEHYWACWAAGTLVGNDQGIHVEICVNSDGNYNSALKNASSLVAKIMKDENIPIRNVVQHNYFSGKNCPRNIRNGRVSWSQFLQMVANAEPVQRRKTGTASRKYRILTGTFSNRKGAESVVEVMKIRFGWIAYVVQDGDKFRVKTGTFASEADAQSAENKIKVAKLAQVTYILVA
ncbi:N-acetylmuramoyl-L-alanine amidase [Lysinibacillus contaminans]|uniref:N-acetylmuramoyl-L-alanine amidase n=1 Tax=Lysinibacillus contaminans TaxID=1293441 RepID=UPI0006AFB3E9|nr:N-acetylmuramoyl-L-alanine amidase [Lysinibacillus contaminans]